MRMRVLIAWELGGGLGHLMPMVAIANRLVAEGCSVTIAARDYETAKAMAMKNVGLIQSPFSPPHASSCYCPPSTYDQLLNNIGMGDAQVLSGLVDRWKHIFRSYQPDAIIFEHSPIALFSSLSMSVKKAVMGTGFTCPPVPLPILRQYTTTEKCSTTLDVMNVVGASFGFPELSSVGDLYTSADTTFLRTFAELDHFGERHGVDYLGLAEDCKGSRPIWPTRSGPKIFAYLKRFKGGRETILRIAETQLPTLLYCPHLGIAESKQLATFFPSIQFSGSPIDVRRAAEECDFAISHGGHGFAARMLLEGVPLLTIPLQLEQELLTRRLVSLGAGLQASWDSLAELENYINLLIVDPSYRANAARFKSKYLDFGQQRLIESVVAWGMG